uniref:Secreted protein n=1 Tax=Oryza meridionalis TaxID=40149 RepID=A0A0E0CPI0_9ORYZ
MVIIRFCSAHCKALLPCFMSAATATNTLSSAAAAAAAGGLTSTPTSLDISATLLTDVLKLYCDPLPDVSHRLCTPRPTPSIAAGLPVRRRQSSREGREEICWH